MVGVFLIHFSAFQCHGPRPTKTDGGRSTRHRSLPRMAAANLVPKTHETEKRTHNKIAMELSRNASVKRGCSPAEHQTSPEGLCAVRHQYSAQGLSSDVIDFLVLAWRPGTARNYDCYLKKWLYHCTSNDIDPYKPSVNAVLSYLLYQYRAGLSYSTLGTIRSALSHIISFDGKPLGQHYLIRTFMKSVFQQRPALTKKITWEVNDMLNYLRTLSPIESLTLEQLTKKTLMLMAILSGQRGQTFNVLQATGTTMTANAHNVTFYINDQLKTTRPGHHLAELKFKAFPCDRRLCVVTYINAYKSRTDRYRVGDVTSFFVTYGYPNGNASRDSIYRWTKDIMRDAGFDLSLFKAHSTRSAGTSAARTVVTMDTILKAGNWSTANTFTKYYNLQIVDLCGMQSAIMNRFKIS